MRKILYLPIFALACLHLAAQKKPVTLESVGSGRPPRTVTPVWSPSGDQFVYTEAGTLNLIDCATGKSEQVIRLVDLRNVAVKSSENDSVDWTNRRVSAEPVQWFPN